MQFWASPFQMWTSYRLHMRIYQISLKLKYKHNGVTGCSYDICKCWPRTGLLKKILLRMEFTKYWNVASDFTCMFNIYSRNTVKLWDFYSHRLWPTIFFLQQKIPPATFTVNLSVGMESALTTSSHVMESPTAKTNPMKRCNTVVRITYVCTYSI